MNETVLVERLNQLSSILDAMYIKLKAELEWRERQERHSIKLTPKQRTITIIVTMIIVIAMIMSPVIKRHFGLP